MRESRTRIAHLIILLIVSFLALTSTFAVTLEEIRSTPNLTPGKFAKFFSGFKFQFRGEVQSPEVFLQTKSGDCDDFATLAADVLTEKGYTTRMIAVRMSKIVHVVCYIEETQSYLDYNTRNKFNRTISCGPSIAEIADKVAKSYDAKWTSASEFTFEKGVKRLVSTVVKDSSKKVASLSR